MTIFTANMMNMKSGMKYEFRPVCFAVRFSSLTR